MKREKDSDNRNVMKKFTLKGVLENFRTSVSHQSKPDSDIQENLRPENLQVKRTFRHGFPFQPTAMAFDPVQRLLAIGCKTGSLRIIGQPGVDIHVRHDMDGPLNSAAVLFLQFLVNEGALISATADDSLHLWNFRQKIPQIVHSLRFQRERICCINLPLQSKWLHVGSDRGNVHMVNIETFSLSGYVINWNKAIEISRKTHPGAVVHLSENPVDASKLLIGYESGLVVLWDVKNKMAELRWQTTELRSISWHYEGKQFMCAHVDGTLTTWSTRDRTKYLYISHPHAKQSKDGKMEQCKSINKIEWKLSKSGEAFLVFSGGLPYDQDSKMPSITVVHNKTTTVLEMESDVIDFISLCESFYANELQEPYAVIVLLQTDLVVIDLQTSGFPCLENPYPMDIHESAVTCLNYFADCPADLIPALYSVGRARQTKRQELSEMDWPISGGLWSAQSCSYSEIIITGHADGSIKFWDASAGTLQILYKLKTAKIFERQKSKSGDNDSDVFAIDMIALCPKSKKLCIAGTSSYVILCSYSKSETNGEIGVLEVPIDYKVSDEEISVDVQLSELASTKMNLGDFDNGKDNQKIKVRMGTQKKLPGFQADLVCLLHWIEGEPRCHITALSINSFHGLMAFGNEVGIVVVDMERKICILNIQDSIFSIPKSPQKNLPFASDTIVVNQDRDEKQFRSPSCDEINGACSSSLPSVGYSGNINDRLRQDPQQRFRLQDQPESSFSRSRSSSMSSIENPTSESIQYLVFTDSYAKKSDPTLLVPCLWVGTSSGLVLTIFITSSESSQSPVAFLNENPVGRMRGMIKQISFLDENGLIFTNPYESRDKKDMMKTQSKTNVIGVDQQMKGELSNDKQYLVAVSEKQARVIGLPSQSCIYRQTLTEVDNVVKADIISIADNVCLMCYISNGHLMSFSLPSIRPLIDIDFLPLTEIRIARTFCFSNRGHGLYLTSPFEIQKFTVCSDFCANLMDFIGELFLSVDMPELPKEGFFKGLFGSGVRTFDREELFGESSGKASKSVAKHIPGSLHETNTRVISATSEISKAHKLIIERGEKLSQLEDKTERMRNEAENFQSSAHDLMIKYKDKKWYQL